MGFFGISLDVYDVFLSILMLVITSGFVNALLQYLKLNVCQDARLVQAGVLFLLGLLFGSSFTIVLSIIELVIGITDYIAVSNNQFAWLDPNLA